MEGGGIDIEPHSQALYEGEVVGAGGYATPTYTIVQLALRLGDHLGGVLKG
jgi:hypothetical protein